MDTSSVPLKRCACCGHHYPKTTEHFNKDKNRKDGLYSYCKSCSRAKYKQIRDSNPEKERERGREWYRNNREYKLAKNQAWYDSHPEKVKLKHAKRYWSDPQRHRERTAKYKATHRAAIRARQQQWAQENPDKVRLAARKRRARLANASGSHTTADVHAQFNSQQGRCWWCNKSVGDDYHVDHRIPISRGGSNAPENLCISCPSCNESKRDKLPQEWNGRLL